MCINPELTSVQLSYSFESIKETPQILKYCPQNMNKTIQTVDKPVDGVNNSEKRDIYVSEWHLTYFVEFHT
jgi:hypothetical protein